VSLSNIADTGQLKSERQSLIPAKVARTAALESGFFMPKQTIHLTPVQRQSGQSRGCPSALGQWLVAYLILSMYLTFFVILVIVAFNTQNFVLLSIIPWAFKELAYAFRKAIDFILTPNHEQQQMQKDNADSSNANNVPHSQ